MRSMGWREEPFVVRAGIIVSWIKGTISRRLEPITFYLSVCGMIWKRQVDKIRDAMCKLRGLDPIKPSTFDCIVPMSAPLESREEPMNMFN